MIGMANDKAILGCILGTAVGDALGLPYEGISPARIRVLLGPPARHRFIFGRGMISDDTEHTVMVSQSLIESGDDVEAFTKKFASRLRWWMLALPAGVGKATAQSCLKLWFGFGPASSGVFSAGNGPSMRASIFGATIDEHSKLLEFVKASARLTHTDPKAEYGAIAIALAARASSSNEQIDRDRWLAIVQQALPADAFELVESIRLALDSVACGESTRAFASSLGLDRGVTGYTYHTVPVAIHCWLSFPCDFQNAVASAIECGGDADTTAAIVGGIVGARVGKEGIPAKWLSGIWEWPRSVPWMESIGIELSRTWPNSPVARAPRTNPLAVVLRNFLFMTIVVCHGFRRLGPPYR